MKKYPKGHNRTAPLIALLLSLAFLCSACGSSTRRQTPETDKPAAAVVKQEKKSSAPAAGDRNKAAEEKEDTQVKETEEKNAEEKTPEQPEEEKKTEEDAEKNVGEEAPKSVMEIDPDTGKDKYQTDPVPEGKPAPVEPQEVKIDSSSTQQCTFSIRCDTILNNLDQCEGAKKSIVPANGTILPTQAVTFSPGESVYDVLQRVCKNNGIHMEASWTPIYNSAYIEGIANLYEFDVGELSGWMYKVNGWFPNDGCSRYSLANGDVVEWVYTCDLGYDVGGGYAVGG